MVSVRVDGDRRGRGTDNLREAEEKPTRTVPAHDGTEPMDQSDRIVVDFDQQGEEYHADRHAVWADMRKCPVAFSPRYGASGW
jgi:hypothetical protein